MSQSRGAAVFICRLQAEVPRLRASGRGAWAGRNRSSLDGLPSAANSHLADTNHIRKPGACVLSQLPQSSVTSYRQGLRVLWACKAPIYTGCLSNGTRSKMLPTPSSVLHIHEHCRITRQPGPGRGTLLIHTDHSQSVHPAMSTPRPKFQDTVMRTSGNFLYMQMIPQRCGRGNQGFCLLMCASLCL